MLQLMLKTFVISPFGLCLSFYDNTMPPLVSMSDTKKDRPCGRPLFPLCDLCTFVSLCETFLLVVHSSHAAFPPNSFFFWHCYFFPVLPPADFYDVLKSAGGWAAEWAHHKKRPPLRAAFINCMLREMN